MDERIWSTAARASLLAIAALVTLVLVATFMSSAQETVVEGFVFNESTMETISGATVTIAYRDNGTVVGTDETGADGRYIIRGMFHGNLTLLVEAEGYNESLQEFYIPPVFRPYEEHINALMSPVTGPSTPPSTTPTPPYLLWASIMAILIISSMVMYSKIKRDNLLKHAVRKRIHDYVDENPGAHYRAILDDLELSMGVLTYHLNRLEKAEYLKSRQDGMYRRFYITGRKTEIKFFLSDVQENILATIAANQGISQSSIAKNIGVTRKVVNYHVRILDQAGLIYMEDRGRETACFSRECRAATSS
jgi:DNA-binding MarR family transcriptional regulator